LIVSLGFECTRNSFNGQYLNIFSDDSIIKKEINIDVRHEHLLSRKDKQIKFLGLYYRWAKYLRKGFLPTFPKYERIQEMPLPWRLPMKFQANFNFCPLENEKNDCKLSQCKLSQLLIRKLWLLGVMSIVPHTYKADECYLQPHTLKIPENMYRNITFTDCMGDFLCCSE
jgi:hypothetical protein